MSDYKKRTGNSGEEIAAEFLTSQNFTIISRNFRYKKAGEIDIIASKNNLLIFVEVKNRTSNYFGGALYSINPKKKQSIRFIANQFLNSNPAYSNKDIICRFDMIAIENGKIEWIEDIFR